MRILYFIEFIIFYLKEILISNIRIAHDVLTPTHHMTPGIITVDVSYLNQRQVAAMANFITMTPGTLGVFVSGDCQTLYIHSMYIDTDPETVGKDLAREYGRRVKNVF